MKPGLLLIATFISVFVIMAIGASCGTSEVTLASSCDDFQSNAVINKQVEIPLNGTLKVDLCSNASTGFKWSDSATISDSKIIKQTDHITVAPESKDKVGVPGKEVWTFKALKAGTCTITNEYSQPWQGGTKGTWKYNITITVK